MDADEVADWLVQMLYGGWTDASLEDLLEIGRGYEQTRDVVALNGALKREIARRRTGKDGEARQA